MKETDIVDNNLEQSQESTQAPSHCSLDQLDQIHEAGNALIHVLRNVADGDLVGEIVANALKLLKDRYTDLPTFAQRFKKIFAA